MHSQAPRAVYFPKIFIARLVTERKLRSCSYKVNMSDLARVNTSEFHSSALYSYSRFPTTVTSCYGLMARLIEGFKEQWTRVVPVSAQSMSLTVSRTFALTRCDDAPSFEEGGASIRSSTASARSTKPSRNLEFKLATRFNLYLLNERYVLRGARERIPGHRMIYA